MLKKGLEQSDESDNGGIYEGVESDNLKQLKNKIFFQDKHKKKPNFGGNSLSNNLMKTKSFLNDDKQSISVIKDDSTSKQDDDESIDDILKNQSIILHDYICSQQGSRIFQKQLSKILPEKLDVIIQRLSGYFKQVMTDMYGNYFCQRLAQCSTSEQRIYIIKNVGFLNLFF